MQMTQHTFRLRASHVEFSRCFVSYGLVLPARRFGRGIFADRYLQETFRLNQRPNYKKAKEGASGEVKP
jgi:hypothetical protein